MTLSKSPDIRWPYFFMYSSLVKSVTEMSRLPSFASLMIFMLLRRSRACDLETYLVMLNCFCGPNIIDRMDLSTSTSGSFFLEFLLRLFSSIFLICSRSGMGFSLEVDLERSWLLFEKCSTILSFEFLLDSGG